MTSDRDDSGSVDELFADAPEDSIVGEMASDDMPAPRREEFVAELLSPVTEDEVIESNRPADLLGEWDPAEDDVLAEKIAVEEAIAGDGEGGLFTPDEHWEALKEAAEFDREAWDYDAIRAGEPRSQWRVKE